MTTKQEISDALVRIGASGVENIGGAIDKGVEYLKGLASGNQTPPAPTDERYAPELTTQAGPEAELSVVEELKNTAGQLTSQLTKKAQNAIDATKKKLENPQSVEEAPTIKDNEPVATVELDSKTENQPIVTLEAANVLTNNDSETATIMQNITKGDVGNMINDLPDVTDDESFESYVSKYVKQYQELFKEDEDQIAKDKGFALAIFGSVYGSTGDWGQASAAMIDMLRGDKATRQARADKVKMLAINSAADRKAADLRYRRELAVAKARGSGKNTYDAARERSRLKEIIVADPFLFPTVLGPNKQLDPKLLNEYLDELVGGSVDSDTNKTGGGANENMIKEMEKLNNEAKAAGKTEYNYNGQRYPVQ